MTRGKIVIILNGEVMLISTEFNGDMYYEGHGQDIIEHLNNINTEEEYKQFIKEFNKENFEYNDSLIYKVEGDDYESYLNMSVDYFDKWFSDYVYIKNLSDYPVKFIDENEYKCVLKPNEIGVFYFGEIANDIEENRLEISIDDTEAYVQSLVSDDSVDLDEMYYKCLELEDVYDDSIYIRESLIDIMYEHAKAGHTFYAMARDLDDNSECNYFWFDWSCWGDGCTPIKTKEELAQVLLDGSL